MALLMGNVECVAACSVAACRPQAPPCHRHHDAPQHGVSPCIMDELATVAEPHRRLAPAVAVAACPGASARVPATIERAGAVVAAAVSPPGPRTSFVPRI
jgi:hypothetical protein